MLPAVLSSRPARAVGTALALAFVAEWWPALGFLRVLEPAAEPEVTVVQHALSAAPLARSSPPGLRQEQGGGGPPQEQGGGGAPGEQQGASSASPAAKVGDARAESPRGGAPLPLVGTPESMQRFYRALARSARREPGAVTRIAYHGDSIVASDYVTGTLRRRLQERFGDAGHGFVLVADPWPSYFHNDVARSASKGWSFERIVGPYANDGHYGLGGVSVRGVPGARARIGTGKQGPFGLRASRFELWFLRAPGGGELDVVIDGALHSRLRTDAPEPRSDLLAIDLADGEHALELVVRAGSVRVFGVVLERREVGVVLDALGVQGARLRTLDRQHDTHWVEQLAQRSPDLLVFHYGANESVDAKARLKPEYERSMQAVLERAVGAVPGVSCLVLGALDRAEKKNGVLVTVPIIPAIVAAQERVARAVGCAFWNTFEAMGGTGAMARWRRGGLGQADLIHPTAAGAELLGGWIFEALLAGYHEHESASVRAAAARVAP